MALRSCDTFVTNFQKGEDVLSNTVTFVKTHGSEVAINLSLGAPNKQHIWLVQGTFTHESIYKLTRSTGPEILQTYKTYTTYKAINLHSKAPQPDGPQGAGGFSGNSEGAISLVGFVQGRMIQNT